MAEGSEGKTIDNGGGNWRDGAEKCRAEPSSIREKRDRAEKKRRRLVIPGGHKNIK